MLGKLGSFSKIIKKMLTSKTAFFAVLLATLYHPMLLSQNLPLMNTNLVYSIDSILKTDKGNTTTYFDFYFLISTKNKF